MRVRPMRSRRNTRLAPNENYVGESSALQYLWKRRSDCKLVTPAHILHSQMSLETRTELCRLLFHSLDDLRTDKRNVSVNDRVSFERNDLQELKVRRARAGE